MYVTESHTASLHITETSNTPPAHCRCTINSRVFSASYSFQYKSDVPSKCCEFHSGMNFAINKCRSKIFQVLGT